MLDLKEEQRYRRLRRLAQELHIPIPEAFLTLEVFDKNGNLIQKHHQRSHSWTRNAYNAMFANLASVDLDDVTFGAGLLSGKDTGGVVVKGSKGAQLHYLSNENTAQGYRAPSGEALWGIVVGEGTNAESFEDYVLQTQLVEGTGGGQISHATSEATNKTYVGLVFKNELVRYFNNNTGGNRNINEVGIYSFYYFYGESNKKLLVVRDKLASTVTVPDTGQLKVTYTIQLTYPA